MTKRPSLPTRCLLLHQRPQTLVLLSGDGNVNNGGTTFPWVRAHHQPQAATFYVTMHGCFNVVDVWSMPLVSVNTTFKPCVLSMYAS